MARRFSLLVALLSTCVGCDQVSKSAAVRCLEGVSTTSYLGDTFRLTYAENRGAFLGMGADWPEPVRWIAFTVVGSALVGLTLLFVLQQAREGDALRLDAPLWGALLLAAGGVGNMIDRFTRDGAVIDFMNMGVGPLRTGIFNVADTQIMLGAALLALWHRGRDTRTTLGLPDGR